ncbi:MAG TPA: hypothetical protein VGB24_11420 [Longimicrobium sp.]|jgi:hypothetical protein|uniref:hypothetical protein n=1 Tax=Longimicrobium sp. TaxID=2029185 RepID=UPI002ED94A48
MNRATGALASTRRLALLLGTLLHLVGVAALPALHAWGSGLDVPPASTAGHATLAQLPDAHPDGLPPHDELHCVVCHAHGSVALPVDAPRIGGEHAAVAGRLPQAPTLASSLVQGATRARAPPVA